MAVEEDHLDEDKDHHNNLDQIQKMIMNNLGQDMGLHLALEVIEKVQCRHHLGHPGMMTDKGQMNEEEDKVHLHSLDQEMKDSVVLLGQDKMIVEVHLNLMEDMADKDLLHRRLSIPAMMKTDMDPHLHHLDQEAMTEWDISDQGVGDHMDLEAEEADMDPRLHHLEAMIDVKENGIHDHGVHLEEDMVGKALVDLVAIRKMKT